LAGLDENMFYFLVMAFNLADLFEVVVDTCRLAAGPAKEGRT
jgi:hypothetical protein